MLETISFWLNGQPVQIKVAADRTLLWVLRTDLGLTGPKYGCGITECGACTVLVNQRVVRSCGVKIKAIEGAEVTTIEGLAKDGKLHPVQEAFMAHDALQCGFCTPGMILTACVFLSHHPNPTRAEVLTGMEHNLCRCGAHNRIVDAILAAAAAMKGGSAT